MVTIVFISLSLSVEVAIAADSRVNLLSSCHQLLFGKKIETKEVNMGDKGKKDKSKREGQKKSMHTIKEKRKQKKEKAQHIWPSEK